MDGSARRIGLALPRLPAIAIVWTGLSLTVATALAQTPPVRGGVRGELRTPSGFSPIDLHSSAASVPTAPPAQSSRVSQHSSAASKTPIRRDSAAGDDERPTRTGIGSPWTTLGALAAVLIGVVGATRLLRRWTRHSGEAFASHHFDVLGGRRLDAQSNIHLVRIGRRIVAVGSSPAGLQALTVIDEPLEVEELLGGRKLEVEVRKSEDSRRPWEDEGPKQRFPAPTPDLRPQTSDFRRRTSDLHPAVKAARGSGGEARDA